MCWTKINSKHLICEYCNNFIHFKCASFKNHLKQRPELWICSYCALKELPFSSESDIDIPDELLTESISENNKDTQRDDNYSNKLKDPSKYYSLSHLNTQSMTFSLDEFQVMLKEHPTDVTDLFETWLKNNKYLLSYVTKPGYSFIYWFTLDRKNPKQFLQQ